MSKFLKGSNFLSRSNAPRDLDKTNVAVVVDDFCEYDENVEREFEF